jgi:hypothetical protein
MAIPRALPHIYRAMRAHRARLRLALSIFASFVVPAPLAAQQAPVRSDSTALRSDYRNIDELLRSIPKVPPPTFDEERALWLGALPLACLDRLQSRPGPRGANSGAGYFWSATYSLVPDHDRLRAFWGCSDWHSAVGSTWVMVRLLKTFSNTSLRELAREKLNAHLGKSNLDGEMSFFRAAAAAVNPIPSANQAGLFERPYGFAWLLELQSELRTWPDTQAQRWAANVAPLAAWMADSLADYLNKVVEPARGGTQSNTAQSMTLALDYSDVVGNTRLRRAIVSSARRFYLADTACATQSELVTSDGGRGRRGAAGAGGTTVRAGRGAGRAVSADSASESITPNDLTASAGRGAGRGAAAFPQGGADVVSPCLTEAALMSRVLQPHAYLAWLDKFLPPLQSERFAPLTEPIPVPLTAPPQIARGGGAPDTSAAGAAAALAAERARRAGLSFSRAQSMERIARALPPADPRVRAFHRLSSIQADRGFTLMRGDAGGLAWVPAQALLYEADRK